MTERYPATEYDRDVNKPWSVNARPVSQIRIGTDLAHAVAHGLTVRGGPLTEQLDDGSQGAESGSVLSVVWGSSEREDGTRRVLGWYESSR